MPVARVITQYPEESHELVRQLTAAGYTVKFTAPDEEFDDADLVVSAANVHQDFALQYAAEVAQDCNAEVIVAPGVVRGAAEEAQVVEPTAPTIVREPLGERLRMLAEGVQERWQTFRNERALTREQKRLERERQAMEAEDRRQEALRLRAAEEARIAAERERLRLQRQAREEETRRASEAEIARIAAEQERVAAERERLRLERQAQEEERRRQAEAERERAVPNPEPVRAEFYAPVVPPPAPVRAPAAPTPPRAATTRRAVAAHRRGSRRQTMQRALIAASIVALVLMIVFAIAINTDTRSPLSNGVVNSTVQEESPFGPAHNQPVPAAVPVVHAAAPAPSPAPSAATTAPKPKPPAARPARRSRQADDGYVARDEVIIHHYGQAAKRPARSQARAGIPHYSDQQ